MPSRRASHLDWIAPASVALLAAVFAIHRIEDFDTWFHLAAGRLMLATHTWPSANTFSLTAPEYPWVDLHWIFQLLLYAAWQVGGPNGAIVLAATLMVTTSLILYGLARRFVPPTLAAFLMAVALMVSSPRFVPRPELLSFVYFAVYLVLLEGYPRNGRAIYLLVPLQILWVNTQGIFAVGVALIGCYWLGAALAFLPVPARLATGERTHAGPVATADDRAGPRGLRLLREPVGRRRRALSLPAPAARHRELALLEPHRRVSRAVEIGVRAAARLHVAQPARRDGAVVSWPTSVAGISGDCSRRSPSACCPRSRSATWRSSVGWPCRRSPPTSAPGPALAHCLPWLRGGLAFAALAAIVTLTGAVVTNQLSRLMQTEREFGLGVSNVRFPADAIAFIEHSGHHRSGVQLPRHGRLSHVDPSGRLGLRRRPSRGVPGERVRELLPGDGSAGDVADDDRTVRARLRAPLPRRGRIAWRS